MDVYALVKFLHLVGVLLLFAATAIELAALRALRGAATVASARQALRSIAPLKRMFPAASLLILTSGLILVIMAWGWTTAWINVGLIALITASAVAPRLNGPRFAAIGRASAEAPADAPVTDAMRAAIADPVLHMTTVTLALSDLGVVYLMTAKPDLIASIVSMGIVIGLGLVAGHRWGGGPDRPAARPAPRGVAD
jgi:hypothetical protein